MEWLLSLLIWSSVFALLGTLVGSVTGLVPGLHPNTIAVLIMGFPQLTSLLISLAVFSGLPEESGGGIFLGAFLIGVLVAHSFIEIIPTAMMGIAGDDTFIALLPAQRLFSLGKAELIFQAAVIGGLGSVAIFALLLFPMRIVMGEPVGVYSSIRPFMWILLIAISSAVLLSTRGLKRLFHALLVFGASGAIGIVVLSLQVPYLLTKTLFGNALSLDSSSFLLPVFAGFFAIPSILFSRPRQFEKIKGKDYDRESAKIPYRPLFQGILPSILVGWIPGVTNAYATALAFAFKKRKKLPIESSFRYLITYSATNMGGALQAIVALATINRPRNGTLEAIASLISHEELNWPEVLSPPIPTVLILWSACLASICGATLCIILGRRLLCRQREKSITWVRPSVLIFLLALVLWSSGPIGFLILLLCFLLGSWAIAIGASRVHLMGFLIVPASLYFMIH